MSAYTELARAIAAKQREARSSEHLATVLRVDADGTYWVHVPGGADETPVSTAMVEAEAGDVARVSIANGRCVMTGNVTNPAATSARVNAVGQMANRAYTTAYEERARIDELETTKLTAMQALITELQVDTGTFDKLFADALGAYVVVSTNATVAQLEAAIAKAEELDAELVRVTQATVDMLLADSASVTELNAATAIVSSAAIASLKADVANIAHLRSDKADIDAANITTATVRAAWIDQLMVQTGLLAQSGTVYTLDAIQVNAANITAGTLDVERLVVSVTEQGVTHKYLVHVDTSGSTPVTTYEKLDGDVIGDHTIAASKIVAHSITANEITANNLVGTGGWINLANGTFSYTNSTTGDGISWDGTNLTISSAAITAAIEVGALVHAYGGGVLVCKQGNSVGALVNVDGSFDVVAVTWSGTTPTVGDSLSSFSSNAIELGNGDDVPYVIGRTNSSYVKSQAHSDWPVPSASDVMISIKLPKTESGYPFNAYICPMPENVYLTDLSGMTLTPEFVMSSQGESDGPSHLVIDAGSIRGYDVDFPVPGVGYITLRDHDGYFDEEIESRSLDPADFPMMYVLTAEYTPAIAQVIADGIADASDFVTNPYYHVYLQFTCDYSSYAPSPSSDTALAMFVGGRGTLPVYKYESKPPETIVPACPSIVVTEDGGAWLVMPD